MIVSFFCRETEKIWNGERSRAFPPDIQERALRKLRQLDAATCIADLRNPPSNRLEPLHADRKGQMSIRINNQWRLCFIFEASHAKEVQIVDYH